jgi:hypothetical protein
MKDYKDTPCSRCVDYDKYAKDTIYFWNTSERKFEEPVYNVVDKPKHYMLFPEKDVEVRDVINKLLERMYNSRKYDFSPIDYADYTQAMQYFMRFMDKNGLEDLQKGLWYITKMIEGWKDATNDTGGT